MRKPLQRQGGKVLSNYSELLEQYQVQKDLLPLIEIQLTKLFNHYNADQAVNDNQLQKQHTSLQNQ